MKGIIQGKTIVLLDNLPDDLQQGSIVEISIENINKNGINASELISKPGLHLGAISISEDFDDPLSDEFWLGEL